MTARTVCLIQARQGSSRLPGKSLRILQGRPMIAHVLERAAAIPGVHDVVLATSDCDRDEALAMYARSQGYGVYRGSHGDVLERMFLAATLARATTVVRVTGDCCFFDPAIGGEVLQAYFRYSCAADMYAWNDTAHSGFPDGTDVEVFGYQALANAAVYAQSPAEREHVTPWLRDALCVWTHKSEVDYSDIKLSVDTLDDLALARAIAARLPARDFSLAATLSAYRQVREQESL